MVDQKRDCGRRSPSSHRHGTYGEWTLFGAYTRGRHCGQIYIQHWMIIWWTISLALGEWSSHRCKLKRWICQCTTHSLALGSSLSQSDWTHSCMTISNLNYFIYVLASWSVSDVIETPSIVIRITVIYPVDLSPVVRWTADLTACQNRSGSSSSTGRALCYLSFTCTVEACLLIVFVSVKYVINVTTTDQMLVLEIENFDTSERWSGEFTSHCKCEVDALSHQLWDATIH